jgi:hypothetical protein
MSENSRRNEIVKINEEKWRELGLDVSEPPPPEAREPATLRLVRVKMRGGRPVPLLPPDRRATAQKILDQAAKRILNGQQDE